MPQPTLFRQARFMTSVAALETLPPEGQGEIAFAGRSNAGKSSALNTLADQKQLAFVSKTPGRTQLINYFDLGDGHHLVDLPGYGYAKVPAAVRAPWERLLGDYLLIRRSLKGMAVIMDSRHPMTELDLRLLRWFLPTGKPVHVLLSKADKLTRADATATLKAVRAELAGVSHNYSAQLFSALKKTGIEEAEEVFAAWLEMEWKPADQRASKAGAGGKVNVGGKANAGGNAARDAPRARSDAPRLQIKTQPKHEK